ncbi:MAG: hypothetical protein GX147_02245 [Deltaproteobacteria bacterium]|nr:hypothetical protein [Deltaproteobacteria bacterium]
MGGKTKILIGFIGFMMMLAWSGGAWAIEYGNFEMSGWVRNQIAYNIGQPNPYNVLGEMADGRRDRINLKMFKTSVQLKPQYHFTDNVSVFARTIASIDRSVETDYPGSVDHFPKSYDMDLLLTGDEWMIGLKELYMDFDSQYVWLRLGKQQVSWGQSDGLRLLDIINPLDKSWHGISLNEPYLDAFDNVRESLWMARLTLKSPWETDNLQDVQLELLWLPGHFIGSQFVGHINPVHGSPYNFEPDMFTNREVIPGGQEFGARLMGKYRALEWSLNYFRHYEDDGLYQMVDAGPGHPWKPFHIVSRTVHPRVDSYGFSMTYDDALNTKAVYRLEFLYQDRPYEKDYINGADPWPTDIERRKTIKALLGIDRPTFVKFLNPTRTVSFGFQAFVTQVVEHRKDIKKDGLTLNGSHPSQTTTMFSFSADTGYMQDRIKPNMLYIFDPGRKGHYLQVGTEFRLSDNILWYVGATLYDGKHSDNAANDNLAYFEWADEIQSRITFQF